MTVTTPPVDKKSLPHVKLKWEETAKGTEWVSTTTPNGEIAPARIRMSSRNSDGSYSYFCYRNAAAVAVVRLEGKSAAEHLARAKDACERGPNPKLSDKVLDYVENHPLDVPFWLKLNDGERRAVRAQYPYAAPSRASEARSVARGMRHAGDLSDPGTREMLARMEREQGSRAAGGAGQPATPRRARAALSEQPLARLAPVPGVENPGRPGTKRHAGYELILGAALAGRTVAEALAAGAKPERLAKCVAKGMVQLMPPGPAPTKAEAKTEAKAEKPARKAKKR